MGQIRRLRFDELAPELQSALHAKVDRYGHGAANELARAVDALGEEAAVGVLLTVGRYVAHAAVANTLELAAPVEGVLPAAAAGSTR